MAAAIAAVNDTTGKAAFTDQVSAYRTLLDFAGSNQNSGPARTATSSMLVGAPFTKQVDATAQQFYSTPLTSGSAVLALLNKQSAQQQELVFLGSGYGQGFASLNAWKSQMSEDRAATNAESSPDQSSSSSIKSSTRNIALPNVPASTAARSAAVLNLTRPTFSNADIALTFLQGVLKTYGRNQLT